MFIFLNSHAASARRTNISKFGTFISAYRNKFLTLALVCDTNTMKLILKPPFKCYQFMERPFSKLSFDGDLHC